MRCGHTRRRAGAPTCTAAVANAVLIIDAIDRLLKTRLGAHGRLDHAHPVLMVPPQVPARVEPPPMTTDARVTHHVIVVRPVAVVEVPDRPLGIHAHGTIRVYRHVSSHDPAMVRHVSPRLVPPAATSTPPALVAHRSSSSRFDHTPTALPVSKWSGTRERCRLERILAILARADRIRTRIHGTTTAVHAVDVMMRKLMQVQARLV